MSADSSMAEVTMICMDSSALICDGRGGLITAQLEAIELYCSEKIKAHPGNLVGFTTIGGFCLFCEPSRDLNFIKSKLQLVEFLGSLQLGNCFHWATYAFRSARLPNKRLVFFAGGLLHTTISDLEDFADLLREVHISVVDVVNFGIQDRTGRKNRLLLAFVAAMNGRYLYAPSGSPDSLTKNLKRSPIMPRSSLEETKTVENDENVDPLGMKKVANSKDQPRKNNRRQNRTRTKAAVADVRATWNEQGWLTPKSIPIC